MTRRTFVGGLAATLVVTAFGAETAAPPLVRAAAPVRLESPGGVCRLMVSTDAEGRPVYALSRGETAVVRESPLGFTFARGARDMVKGFALSAEAPRGFDETWKPVWGEEDEIRNRYREVLVRFENAREKTRFNVRFRLFDEGLGFRYEFPMQDGQGFLRALWFVRDELTEFRLGGDPTCWWIPCDFESQEYEYAVTKASGIAAERARQSSLGNGWTGPVGTNLVQTALLMRLENGLWVRLHEAACADFATLNLAWEPAVNGFRALLTPAADGTRGRLTPPFVTPWRTIEVAARPEGLLASRLTLNLNEPCAIADTSWIRPIKYLGVWWQMMGQRESWDPSKTRPETHSARTANVIRYLDFAAANGFDALLIEGWAHRYASRSEDGLRTVRDFRSTYDDVDMEAIAAHSRKVGVPLCLHNEAAAAPRDFERQIDVQFAYYRAHNATSMKIGYVGPVDPAGTYHYSQWMNNHYNYLVRRAADHRLMVNQHEAVRPTGLCRTWPNLIANESARGQEYAAFGTLSEGHTDILPFTRLAGGPMDFTPGIVEPDLRPYRPTHPGHIGSTVAGQLALYLTMPGPLQMAADTIENYAANPVPFAFIRAVPLDWSKSVYLSAYPGEHLLVARREKGGRRWFVGCKAGRVAYRADVALDFLEDGVAYTAKLWADGARASARTNPKDLAFSERTVRKGDRLAVDCVAGGGFALSLGVSGTSGGSGPGK